MKLCDVMYKGCPGTGAPVVSDETGTRVQVSALAKQIYSVFRLCYYQVPGLSGWEFHRAATAGELLQLPNVLVQGIKLAETLLPGVIKIASDNAKEDDERG